MNILVIDKERSEHNRIFNTILMMDFVAQDNKDGTYRIIKNRFGTLGSGYDISESFFKEMLIDIMNKKPE